jgi:RimJ/RimL family protein N-acetyltransferase
MPMMKPEHLVAKSIFLRLAMPADAAFIHSLRVNEHYNQFLSSITGGEVAQRAWLEKYKEREKNGLEYYFVICRKDDASLIGTVRLYDFLDEHQSFCWGSWILNANKTASSALESALLVYKLAFLDLAFERSHFDVRKGNSKVIDFHRKLGAVEVGQTADDILFHYEKTACLPILEQYKKFLVA